MLLDMAPDNLEQTMVPDSEQMAMVPDSEQMVMVPDNEQTLAMVAVNFEQTIRLNPEEVKEHFDRIGHFRILVVGRSNAGKTTLLQRVCNTTEFPEIYNSKGEKVWYLIVQRHRSLMSWSS